ncbi:MAG: 30S ribosomal protein S20 [Bacilli bacterium]|jgi:small subunit ribosomal protein S20|nr:30S ribosomal protein S20 [Erysipelotrichia bacterium]
MAQTASQQKRIETNEKARLRNKAFRSKTRTQIKKFKLSLEANDLELAEKHLKEAVSLIDKAVVKNIYHPNTAARQKRHLQSLYNKAKN